MVVSKEVYSAYMRPIWREERNARNRWRCRDANGVRCKKDCIECEIALLGEGATGNDLSLERLVEDEDTDLIRKNDISETNLHVGHWADLCTEWLKEILL